MLAPHSQSGRGDMDNFVAELEEDLKRERYRALWQKYGRFAVAAALVVIIAVAAVVVWRQYQDNRRSSAGLAYVNAVGLAAADKPQDALAALKKLGANGPAGYAELARLQQAAVLASQGNDAAAADIYDAMAKDESADPAFRHLALILYGLSVADRADPAALTARLKPLADGAGPWRYSAQELIALMARRQGDTAKARDIFQRLADDPSAPPGIRARAAEFVALLGK